MKNRIILAFLVLALATTSCDFLRKVAGRPTSGELEQMRLEIADLERIKAEQKAEQLRLDSLVAARAEMEARMVADSLALLDSLRQMSGSMLNPTELGGLYTTKLDSRYYIVVGSFRRRANAEKLFTQVSDADYLPTLISFRNGFNAVGVCPNNKLSEVFNDLKAVRKEPFCPSDVWILLNE